MRPFNPPTHHRVKQGEVSKLIFENNAIQNRICDDFDKRRNPINKPAMNNRRILKVKNDHRSEFSNLSNWKEEA